MCSGKGRGLLCRLLCPKGTGRRGQLWARTRLPDAARGRAAGRQLSQGPPLVPEGTSWSRGAHKDRELRGATEGTWGTCPGTTLPFSLPPEPASGALSSRSDVGRKAFPSAGRTELRSPAPAGGRSRLQPDRPACSSTQLPSSNSSHSALRAQFFPVSVRLG